MKNDKKIYKTWNFEKICDVFDYETYNGSGRQLQVLENKFNRYADEISNFCDSQEKFDRKSPLCWKVPYSDELPKNTEELTKILQDIIDDKVVNGEWAIPKYFRKYAEMFNDIVEWMQDISEEKCEPNTKKEESD